MKDNVMKKIGKIHFLHDIKFRKVADKYDLHFGQMPILEYISFNPGCTQIEISKDVFVSMPCISTSIKRMEKKGLIKKEFDKNDKRITKIFITEKGLEQKNNCKKEFDIIDQEFVKSLSIDELKNLNKILDKLILTNNIKEKENLND